MKGDVTQPNSATTTTTVTLIPKSEKDCINWKTKGKCRKQDTCPYRHDELVRQAAVAKRERKRLRNETGGQSDNHNKNNNNNTTGTNTQSKRKRKQKQPLSVRVFGMHYDTTQDDMRDFFSSCGPIVNLTFPVFEDSGRSKGYCEVLFQSPVAVAHAVALDERLHPGLAGRGHQHGREGLELLLLDEAPQRLST